MAVTAERKIWKMGFVVVWKHLKNGGNSKLLTRVHLLLPKILQVSL
jgi:hypothetical protein